MLVSGNARSIAKDFLRDREKLRLKAYNTDGSGTWTIGYGHTRDVVAGKVITEEEAEMDLEDDVGEAAQAVEDLVKVPLTENEAAALVSFVFNVGRGTFARSTLLKALNAGERARVLVELMKFVWGGPKGHKTVIPGLQARRAAEAALWSTPSGEDPANLIQAAPPPATALDKPVYRSKIAQLATVVGTVLLSKLEEGIDALTTLATDGRLTTGLLIILGIGCVGGILFFKWRDYAMGRA
jgi:lysozyme